MSKRRQRLSKDNRTDDILSKAIGIFSEHGFADASYSLLAKACGIQPSTILYHYKDKYELVEKVIARIATHNHTIVSAAMRPEDDARKRLYKHLERNLFWATTYPDEARITILFYHLTTFNEKFAEIYNHTLATARNRIIEIIMAGQRESAFSKKVEPTQIGVLIHDALLGGIMNLITTNSGEAARKNCLENWKILLDRLTTA